MKFEGGIGKFSGEEELKMGSLNMKMKNGERKLGLLGKLMGAG